jgi:tRNA-2-methylthio-N6-dimethylallyladenosine synthase
MKRGYTALEYKSIVRKLRAERPDLALTTDFIVGFPGETDADFAKTMQLVEDLRFDGAFSFAYSRRPGTPAAELDAQVPPEAKQARLEALQALLDAHYQSYSAAMVGTRQRALVTGPAARNAGELRRAPRTIASSTSGDAKLVGTYVDVTISAALPHSLRGELAAAM